MFHEPEKSCDHSSSSTPSYHFSLDWASLVRTFLHFRSLDKTSKLLSSLDKISLIVQRGADALFSHARHTLKRSLQPSTESSKVDRRSHRSLAQEVSQHYFADSNLSGQDASKIVVVVEERIRRALGNPWD